MQIGLAHEGKNQQHEEQTNNVKTALVAFLTEEGYSLETYSDFHKSLLNNGQIVVVSIRGDQVSFQRMTPEELYGIYKEVKHNDYTNYSGLLNDAQGLIDSFMETFDRTEVFDFNDCIFDGEGNAIHLYGVKQHDFDGDVAISDKHPIIPRAERRARNGGDFVQETHFRRNNRKTKRW